jgi:glycosyltransferase involved in cell wall biosynthesis
MLRDAGVHAKLVEATDNNDIDGLVTEFRPDVVIIEALWVVPEKFDVLKQLHPGVRWIVRLHSDLPFLATEGIAMDWIFGYLGRGVTVAANDPEFARELYELADDEILYLPNYYPLEKHRNLAGDDKFRVGCFGAIRPLKNQLTQAVAAIRFADIHGLDLEFWVNGTRCEQGGQEILKNLRALFANTPYKLVETRWHNHEHFLEIVSCMNVMLCVSFSETFCITAADAVNVGTPLVCSSEIPWASPASIAPTTDVRAIVEKIGHVTSFFGRLLARNRHNLKKYSERSKEIWLEEFQ